MAFEDLEAQRAYLIEHAWDLDLIETARRLKEQADQSLRADIKHSLGTSELLQELGEMRGEPLPLALGLLAEANVRSIGQGQYEAALHLYDRASDIYDQNNMPVEQAASQIGKIGTLIFLDRYAEALETGQNAGEVLSSYGEWFSLAKVVGNLAIAHYRIGDDQAALNSFEQAQELYEKAGMGDSPGWLRAEFNRGIVLRNLGQFSESLQASQRAQARLLELGQPVEAARAEQNLAMTYFVMGRYNETLEHLDHVRDAFLADDRQRDAILAELFTSDCLLQLRRFSDVLEKCQEVRRVFKELGTEFEVGLAIMNEAVAFSGLKRYTEALASLAEAERIFETRGNQKWVAYARMEAAAVLVKQGRNRDGLAAAEACIQNLENQPVKRGQASLIAARANLALENGDEARRYAEMALKEGSENAVPALTYAAHQICGQIAEFEGDLQKAMAAYELAILDLEQLRGRLMVEFRADFLEDKQVVYEDIVAVSLDMARLPKALQYAERAKSRSLFDLLAQRLDLRLSAFDPADQHLAEELVRLRAKYDRLYRRMESKVSEEMHLRGGTDYEQELYKTQVEVQVLEKQITDLWHRLLVRNASYAKEASLWQVHTESVQPYLSEDTLLLEYFMARGKYVLFLVTQKTVQAHTLEADPALIQRLSGRLQLNFQGVAVGDGSRLGQLQKNAEGILSQLSTQLLSPAQESLERYRRLVIVPHGQLHYIPFHAMFHKEHYLAETHEVSYLPAASFLRYYQEIQPAAEGALVVGNSYQGRLAFTTQEAQSIAAIWESQPQIEDQATREAFSHQAATCRLVHLATHGDFRGDNPLFSGLAFQDGWLTTLDIFNLRLKASLVTLSACETGRSVVGGGDELLGLMRAFLYAGAASLVLSQWLVDDRSTLRLMELFYQQLKQGLPKAAALRAAQMQFIQGLDTVQQAGYTHPYYWAPFFLVGDAGPL